MIFLVAASVAAALCALPKSRLFVRGTLEEALRSMPACRSRTARRFAASPVTVRRGARP